MEEFSWERLGNIADGRINLGNTLPVAVYRLLMYTLTDILEENYGKEKSEQLLRQAGFKAGKALAINLLNLNQDFNLFIADLQKLMKDLKIGILRIEKADLENLSLTLSVAEDLDCSGLPVTGETVCFYDEGFIGGILNAYTQKTFEVKEIDCWSTGDRVCRFLAKSVE